MAVYLEHSWKAIVFWIAVLAAITAALGWWYWHLRPSPAMPEAAQEVQVESIQDGDTLEVKASRPGSVIATADPVRVRLIGVDAPDTGARQCWADKAKADLNELAPPGTRLWVIGDVQPADDSGQRLLYAWTPDDVFVNEHLAELGSARLLIMPPNLRYQKEISKKADEARKTRRGLWGSCTK